MTISWLYYVGGYTMLKNLRNFGKGDYPTPPSFVFSSPWGLALAEVSAYLPFEWNSSHSHLEMLRTCSWSWSCEPFALAHEFGIRRRQFTNADDYHSHWVEVLLHVGKH